MDIEVRVHFAVNAILVPFKKTVGMRKNFLTGGSGGIGCILNETLEKDSYTSCLCLLLYPASCEANDS